MSDSSQQDDEWRRLALELGLEPPETSSAKPKPAPPVARNEMVVEESATEELAPARSRRRRGEEREPEEPVEAPFIEPTEEAEGQTFEPQAEPDTVAAAAAAEEVEPSGEAPDTGKRRRRRGRGRRKKGEPVNGAETTEAAGESAEAEAAAGEDEAPAATAADEDEDARPELPADWDVPAWDDLIASLYRPD